MNSLIKADNLKITRGGTPILKEVSLTIGEDDFITVIGPNGAGKSMLLRCLIGIEPPDSGEVYRKEQLKIGYVPQRLTADYIIPISAARFLSLRQKSDKLTLERTIHATDIEAIIDKPLSALSSGEMQRVLLARSLLNNPHLLVLDEPTQNLDISGQIAFYKLLQSIYTERKLSILMVSHDLHMVMACTKKVICLFHHICCVGEPSKIAQQPEFSALFGEDMAKIMTVYQHIHNHEH